MPESVGLAMSIERRKLIIDEVLSKNTAGAESLGVSIRRLRLEVTGLDQATFAKACKITVKTLSSLENDSGNPTLKTLNAILRVFGLEMQMGLQKTQPPTLKVEKEDAQKIKRGASPKRQRSKQRKTDLPSSD
jgi:transcriptional regulator with XRE-family HTH domain